MKKTNNRRSASATPSARLFEVLDSTKKQPQGEAEFRVYGVPRELLKTFQAARESSGLTNEAFLTQIVAKSLPVLVEHLLACGVKHDGDQQSARWPMNPAVLEALRVGSMVTSVPAAHLLIACLRRSLAGQPVNGRKPRRRAAK